MTAFGTIEEYSPWGDVLWSWSSEEYVKNEELVKKMKEHGAEAYLVNTGWNGTGNRISLKDTRAIIDSILGVI